MLLGKIEEKNKLIIVLILFLFLAVRLPGLGKDISNTDAYRWHIRSENFLQALKSGNFKDTYQHYQPGLTLMWLNAPLEQITFSYQYHILGRAHPLTLENSDWYPVIHGLSKAELVLLLSLLLLCQIKLIRKIFSTKIALFFGFLMAVEPYLVGIDRWFHLTSLESYFGFTAVLFLLSWDKFLKEKSLVFSGIFYALALLSKISALLISPLFLLVILRKSWEADGNKVKNYLKTFFYFVTPLVVTGLILFPALVVDPLGIISKMYHQTTAVSVGQYTYPLLSRWLKVFFYDLILLFKLSPITLILFLFAVFNFSKLRKNFSLAAIFTGFLFYYLFLSFFPKKVDRYVIAMIPYMLLITAHSLSELEKKFQVIFLSAAFFYLLFISYIYYPVYSAYYSPLFGGSPKAIQLGLYDNSGEYFAQAAQYLKTKGRESKVFVPDGVVSFSYYYNGKLVDSMSRRPDYVVVSYDSNRQKLDSYNCKNMIAGFGSRVFDLVGVYSCP